MDKEERRAYNRWYNTPGPGARWGSEAERKAYYKEARQKNRAKGDTLVPIGDGAMRRGEIDSLQETPEGRAYLQYLALKDRDRSD